MNNHHLTITSNHVVDPIYLIVIGIETNDILKIFPSISRPVCLNSLHRHIERGILVNTLFKTSITLKIVKFLNLTTLFTNTARSFLLFPPVEIFNNGRIFTKTFDTGQSTTAVECIIIDFRNRIA